MTLTAHHLPLRSAIEALAAIHPGAGMFVRATLVEAAEARERLVRRGVRPVKVPPGRHSVSIAYSRASAWGASPVEPSRTTTVHLADHVAAGTWDMTGAELRACRALGIPWLRFHEQRSHGRSYRRELRRMGVSSRDIRTAVRAGRARIVRVVIDLGTVGIGSGHVYVSRFGMPDGESLVAESDGAGAGSYHDFMRSSP